MRRAQECNSIGQIYDLMLVGFKAVLGIYESLTGTDTLATPKSDLIE